eukprot:2799254-Prorocentrum_lima.AAC.1
MTSVCLFQMYGMHASYTKTSTHLDAIWVLTHIHLASIHTCGNYAMPSLHCAETQEWRFLAILQHWA